MITQEFIMRQLEKWASTKEGKAAIKKKYGVDYDDKSHKALKKYAQMMKEIFYNHTHAVIKSITMDDIIISDFIFNEEGKLTIKISFKEGSLQRESLRPDLYPEGLENIVLLFAHGYDANGIRGQWKNSKSYPAHINSLRHREPNDFLQDAVDEFNSKGGNIAKAVLEAKYR